MKTYRVESERRCLGGTQFYCECPDGEYVPADVARGLLEALKRVRDEKAKRWHPCDDVLQAVNTAIAKAEGEHEETPDERSMRVEGVPYRYSSEAARQEWEIAKTEDKGE